jgi:hypothetical protein
MTYNSHEEGHKMQGQIDTIVHETLQTKTKDCATRTLLKTRMAPEWQVVHVPVVTSVLYNFKCSEISYGRGRKDWILTLIWAGRGKKLITIIRLLYSELSN